MSLTLVRNTKKGPTTFTDPVEKIELEWFGAGDPEGRDIQRVPDKVLGSPHFQKAIDRGILVIEDDESVGQDSMQRQTEALAARESAEAAEVESIMDRTAERTLVTAQISEDGKTVETTIPEPPSVSTEVYEVATDESGIPTTVPADTGEFGPDGKPVDGTIKVVMGDRERG